MCGFEHKNTRKRRRMVSDDVLTAGSLFCCHEKEVAPHAREVLHGCDPRDGAIDNSSALLK